MILDPVTIDSMRGFGPMGFGWLRSMLPAAIGKQQHGSYSTISRAERRRRTAKKKSAKRQRMLNRKRA